MLSITIPFEFVSNNFSEKISSIIKSPRVSAMSDSLPRVVDPVIVFGMRVCETQWCAVNCFCVIPLYILLNTHETLTN